MGAAKRTELIAAAMAAVQEGRLAVEEIVTAALHGRASFARWLERRVRAKAVLEPRRPEVGRRDQFSPEVIERARQIAVRRFAGRGAVAIAWGVAHRHGLTGGEPALVVLVKEKRPLASLPRSRRLPRTLRVRHAGRAFDVPIDVRRLPRGQKEVGERPGRRSMVHVDGANGTISAVIRCATGPAVVVSGHVAGAVGRPARARLSNGVRIDLGRVARVRNDRLVDGARIDGVDTADVPLLSSSQVEIRELLATDLNVRLTVRRAQGDGDVFAFVSALDERVLFRDERGAEAMDGLIQLHTKVSRRGDSGAPVLDFQGRLVGFVVGSANGCTYVIPARRVIDAIV